MRSQPVGRTDDVTQQADDVALAHDVEQTGFDDVTAHCHDDVTDRPLREDFKSVLDDLAFLTAEDGDDQSENERTDLKNVGIGGKSEEAEETDD